MTMCRFITRKSAVLLAHVGGGRSRLGGCHHRYCRLAGDSWRPVTGSLRDVATARLGKIDDALVSRTSPC